MEQPRVNFRTAKVRVGYLISMYVVWNGRTLTFSDDITPETVDAMVLAHTPADDDWLVGWKDDEKRVSNAVYIGKYHDTRNSAIMSKSIHVPRLLDYPWGAWVPSNHRIAKIESIIAGNALQGMVCVKCRVHNPYVDVNPHQPYICQGCKSWGGTVFAPVPATPAVPPAPDTLPG
jgi:hypothetical protein